MKFVKKSGDKESDAIETTPEIKLISALQKKLGGEPMGERLNLTQYKCFLAVKVPSVEQKGDKVLVQAAIALHCPLFDEDLIDMVTGVGANSDDAISQAVENYYNSVWCSLLSLMSDKEESEIIIDALGDKKEYNVYACQTVRMGKAYEKSVRLSELVMPILHKYIGKKPVYWVKLFASRNGDNMIVEARVNGAVFESLAEPLAEYVKKWGTTDKLMAEKEFFFLREEKATPCPYTRKHVFDCVNAIIPLFIACEKPKDYNGIFGKIKELTGDIDLAAELYTFIPEITCRYAVGFKEGDGLMIMRGAQGSAQPINVKKSQIRSYGYAEKAVMEYLVREKPTQEEILRIICVSACYNAIGEALKNGSQLEDLYVPSVAFHVAADYIIK